MSSDQRPQIWQRRPCPPWCVVVHGHYDSPENRECSNEPVNPPAPTRGVGLSLWMARETDSGDPHLPTIDASLEQEPREAEPRVLISYEGGAVVELTLSEAREFRSHLGDQIDMAEHGLSEVTGS